MRCELCQGEVELQATICACGFDRAQRDPAQALARARAELARGRRLFVIGFVGTTITVALLIAFGVELGWARWFFYRTAFGLRVDPVRSTLGIVPTLAVMALGYGAWQMVRAARRIAAGKRMQRLPTARVRSPTA